MVVALDLVLVMQEIMREQVETQVHPLHHLVMAAELVMEQVPQLAPEQQVQ